MAWRITMDQRPGSGFTVFNNCGVEMVYGIFFWSGAVAGLNSWGRTFQTESQLEALAHPSIHPSVHTWIHVPDHTAYLHTLHLFCLRHCRHLSPRCRRVWDLQCQNLHRSGTASGTQPLSGLLLSWARERIHMAPMAANHQQWYVDWYVSFLLRLPAPSHWFFDTLFPASEIRIYPPTQHLSKTDSNGE